MHNCLRRLVVTAAALFTTMAALPPAAVDTRHQEHPAQDGLSAIVRYTEYGIPHIVARGYASLGFGTGWARPPTRCAPLPTAS